jgi:hypothetical protein
MSSHEPEHLKRQRQAHAEQARERDVVARNIAAAFHRTFEGLATREEAKYVLQRLRTLSLIDTDPTVQGDTHATYHNLGRQSLWRDIQKLMNPPTSTD